MVCVHGGNLAGVAAAALGELFLLCMRVRLCVCASACLRCVCGRGDGPSAGQLPVLSFKFCLLSPASIGRHSTPPLLEAHERTEREDTHTYIHTDTHTQETREQEATRSLSLSPAECDEGGRRPIRQHRCDEPTLRGITCRSASTCAHTRHPRVLASSPGSEQTLSLLISSVACRR